MKRLPLGIQTFADMIEDNCYYADKTEFVRRLADIGRYFFLSRPGRFGKSSFLYTIHEAYQGNETAAKERKMEPEILRTLQRKKAELLPRGFIILGIFGSFARGEETDNSVLDLLYELNMDFYNKCPGWETAAVLQDIREDFSQFFRRKVDIANKNALKGISKENILSQVLYV